MLIFYCYLLLLEVHHIQWLSNDGDDTIDNIVALCPNCHRKMHILDLEKDRIYLEMPN
jgi:5-methylcytosine-specific restriction protein A